MRDDLERDEKAFQKFYQENKEFYESLTYEQAMRLAFTCGMSYQLKLDIQELNNV